MAQELMLGAYQKKSFSLDPRTKMLLVVTISTVSVLGGSLGAMLYIRLALAFIPCLFLLMARQFRVSVIYGIVFVMGTFMEIILNLIASGPLSMLLIFISITISHMAPGIMMGYVLLSTTTVSEFVASMERMHMPRQIVIPIAVMFRFFPTVGEEAAAINAAMKMRGITFRSPVKMLEYRLVPLMLCSVKIGEELSAAALTRGLGAPVKRTNICKIGFSGWDILAMLTCVVSIIFFIVG